MPPRWALPDTGMCHLAGRYQMWKANGRENKKGAAIRHPRCYKNALKIGAIPPQSS
jgi:hypothetical protein